MPIIVLSTGCCFAAAVATITRRPSFAVFVAVIGLLILLTIRGHRSATSHAGDGITPLLHARLEWF
jgi:hypothetical protein